MKKGLFIVFEGIDGSGKSTQSKIFASRLYDACKYNDVLLTREPWNSREIRRRLREETDPHANASLMADLYIADRQNHLSGAVIPCIQRGIHVVSDRYKFSTIAYQSTQGLSMDDLISKHEGMLVPDITFFIDVSARTVMERMAGRAEAAKEKKFEQEEFQEKLRLAYLEAARIHLEKGEEVATIDGNSSVQKVSDLVWAAFQPVFSD